MIPIYKQLFVIFIPMKVMQRQFFVCLFVCLFFFYLGFLSRTFTNHWTAGEGGGYFFNSSLPLPPSSQTLAGRFLEGAHLCT